MDMKKILQAMDSASTKPVEGTSDMSKFVSIVNEGANPHKVALPVQMAMNHYQKPAVKKQPKPSVISKYFTEAEEAINQRKEEKRELINQYASTIAQRVLMRESALKDKDDLQAKRKALQDLSTNKDVDQKHVQQRKLDLEKEAKRKGLDEIAGAFPSPSTREKWAKDAAASNAAEAQRQAQLKAQQLEKNTAEVDRLQKINHHSLDAEIPVKEAPIEMTGDPNDPTVYGHAKANPMSLKGRIQQARAQLQDLAQAAESNDLAVWQDICAKAKGGMFMGLEQNLEQIRHGLAELASKRKKGGIASRGIDKNISEDDDPCWKDYKQVGTKKKGGKTVPNCVPKK